MQVSWIEPDQLRDLVGQLQSPAAAGESIAWELHTLPEMATNAPPSLEVADHDLWVPDLSPEVEIGSDPTEEPVEETMFPSAPPPPPTTGTEETAAPPGEPELDRIRQKLQAIRRRAIEAGLLAHIQPAGPSPEQAPEAAVTAHKVEAPAPQVPAPPRPGAFRLPAAAPPAPLESPFALADSAPAGDLRQPPWSGAGFPPNPFEARDQRPSSPAPAHPAGTGAAEAQPAAKRGATGFEVPLGTITERLNAFAGWASRRLQTAGLLIVDDHGDILWGEHAHAGLVVSAMMACTAALRSSALGACQLPDLIEQPISADRILVVLPCPTQFGTIHITLIHHGRMPPEEAAVLRQALAAAVDVTSARSSESMPVGNALD